MMVTMQKLQNMSWPRIVTEGLAIVDAAILEMLSPGTIQK